MTDNSRRTGAAIEARYPSRASLPGPTPPPRQPEHEVSALGARFSPEPAVHLHDRQSSEILLRVHESAPGTDFQLLHCTKSRRDPGTADMTDGLSGPQFGGS